MEAELHEGFHDERRDERAADRSEFEATDVTHSEKVTGTHQTSTKTVAWGGILLVLGVAALVAIGVALSQKSSSTEVTDAAEEEAPISIDSTSSGGGFFDVDVHEPVTTTGTAGDATESTTTPERTEQYTFTTRTPFFLPQNTIFCTLGFHKQNFIPDRYPPDGLCTILVLHAVIINNTLQSRRRRQFLTMARNASKTYYGLDIANENISLIQELTHESQVLWALRKAWSSGVSYYGRLDNDITTETPSENVSVANTLLNALRKTQEHFASSEHFRHHFIFVGVTFLPEREPPTPPPDRSGKGSAADPLTERFIDLIRDVEPAIVVYNIVYARPHMTPDVCMSTGPTVFEQAPPEDQPMLENTTTHYNAMKTWVPKHTRVMFSVTPCGRASTFGPGQDPSFGGSCLNSSLALVNQTVCQGAMSSNVTDHTRRIAVSSSGSYMIAYETMETVWWKLCYGYQNAGIREWAILGVDCSPDSGFCSNSTMPDSDYEFLMFMKNGTEHLATSCP